MQWIVHEIFSRDAMALAKAHPLDWVEIDKMIALARETGLGDLRSFAAIDLRYGLFAFRADRLRAVAIQDARQGDVAHLVLIEAYRGTWNAREKLSVARRAAKALGLTYRAIRPS